MNHPRRIAFLVQFLSIGGIETRLLKILRSIDRNRFEPFVLCARDDGLQADAFKALGVAILVTPGLLAVNRARQAGAVPQVLWAARVPRFDLVVSFLAFSQPFEVWLARFGCRRGGFMYALMNRDRQGVEPYWRQRTACAARIVAVSRKTAEFFHPPEDPAWAKLQVIPNGVDLGRFTPCDASTRHRARAALGLPESAIIFAYPARIAPQKRHEDLLDLAERMVTQAPFVHFALAGQDRRNGWLQAEIARRGLGAMVTWLGPVQEVEHLLAASDALILTSAWEGCPNALLEGLACGLPAVVSHSGAEEFVVEGETGYSLPIGDVEGLASRVLDLARDDVRRNQMGAQARRWMERHGSLDTMLARWFQVFEELGKGDS